MRVFKTRRCRSCAERIQFSEADSRRCIGHACSANLCLECWTETAGFCPRHKILNIIAAGRESPGGYDESELYYAKLAQYDEIEQEIIEQEERDDVEEDAASSKKLEKDKKKEEAILRRIDKANRDADIAWRGGEPEYEYWEYEDDYEDEGEDEDEDDEYKDDDY